MANGNETYKISKSQITDLRNEGRNPFTTGLGVLLYIQSDIDKILEERMRGRKYFLHLKHCLCFQHDSKRC